MSQVSHYSPKLIELYTNVYLSGVEVCIPFDSISDAKAFVLRMQRLRRDLRKEGHEALHSAEACQVCLRGSDVVIKPADAAYIDRVTAALSRLPEITQETHSHAQERLENPPPLSPPTGEVPLPNREDTPIPPPGGWEDNVGNQPTPAEEALKAFMRKEAEEKE